MELALEMKDSNINLSMLGYEILVATFFIKSSIQKKDTFKHVITVFHNHLFSICISFFSLFQVVYDEVTELQGHVLMLIVKSKTVFVGAINIQLCSVPLNEEKWYPLGNSII